LRGADDGSRTRDLRLGHEDFEPDAQPRLRRLSRAQRKRVAAVIDQTLRQRTDPDDL